MPFTIYPAIDLRGGMCVRLVQGDYDQETIYGENPVHVAKQWEAEGAEWLHLVDLDAARSGELTNLDVIRRIVEGISIPVQVGGGIRNLQRVQRLLDIGVTRVILGSAAVDDPEFVEQALAEAREQIVIGIDARDGKVATHGWLETSAVTAEALAVEMAKRGAQRFIFTDISRDGMLSGVGVDSVRQLAKQSGKEVIASGGVGSLEDIDALLPYQAEGIGGVIIGKALYTGRVPLSAALDRVQKGE